MNENGDLWVVSPDEFKILSQSSTKAGRSRASITTVDGQVFVRSGNKLYAFAKKTGPA